jgi:hypothetical protein
LNLLVVLSALASGIVLAQLIAPFARGSLRDFLVVSGWIVVAAALMYGITFGLATKVVGIRLESEVDREPLAAAGVARPLKVIKEHPERVDAYQRLADELNLVPGTEPRSKAFINASDLILSGAIGTHEVQLIATAIRLGAVTKDEIIESLRGMQSSSTGAISEGIL